MTERRIIAVDIGNSRVKAGLIDLAATGTAPDAPLPPVVDCVQLPVKEPMTWQLLQDWHRSAGGADATWWPASVNPPVLGTLVDWLQASGHPYRELRDPSLLPLTVGLPHPEAAGIDRLLNAVATNAVRPPGKPAIVVDAGSAMTIDAVSAEGTFLGGAILPGLSLAARALHEFTYCLPLVEVCAPEPDLGRGSLDPAAFGDLQSATGKGPRSERNQAAPTSAPPSPLGKNTVDALFSGLYWGNVGAVRELLDRLTELLGWKDPFIVSSGGDAAMLTKHLGRTCSLQQHLTLQGIALTARRQKPPRTTVA